MDKCGSLQQWGSPTDPDNEKLGICIIDGCMNLPLLYWASNITGETEFYEKAVSHITNAANYMMRDSGAVHQNLKFDVFTGELLSAYTSQETEMKLDAGQEDRHGLSMDLSSAICIQGMKHC